MSLELEQDEKILRRESRLERVGWLALSLFLLAGLLGLLGPGPLSARETTSPGGVVGVEYDSVIHHEADTSVTFRVGPEAIEEGAITVTVVGDWVSSIDVQGISPEPSEQRAVTGGFALEVAAEEGASTELVVSFRAQSFGPIGADVSVGDESIRFSQFVLP